MVAARAVAQVAAAARAVAQVAVAMGLFALKLAVTPS